MGVDNNNVGAGGGAGAEWKYCFLILRLFSILENCGKCVLRAIDPHYSFGAEVSKRTEHIPFLHPSNKDKNVLDIISKICL